MQDQTFAIVSDIDGVIQMGMDNDMQRGINNLQKEKIPLYITSNAGGISEKQETQMLSSKLNVKVL